MRPLSEDEFARLERNILRDGIDPSGRWRAFMPAAILCSWAQ
jgi:hypothetical protein